jgi:hypothetical protein
VHTEIETHIFEETLRLFNLAAAKGLAESMDPEVVTDRFLYELRTNNAVFSAFRTHRMQNDIATQLIDRQTGQLKSFDRWKRDIKEMTDHYVHSWLKTEYDTAVIRAHQAADWKHFIDEADVFPNVRWMPTTSITPDPLHERYWAKKLTLPVNHPFWQEHRPGERWNCKCTLQQTDEPVNAEALDGYTPAPAQPGLDNNPAKGGKLFSDDHPYYTEAYPGADIAVKDSLGINPGWIPAETLSDAEAFASRFVKEFGLDREFKGKVSYKGIDLSMANRINHTLVEAFERLEMPEISGIKVVSGKSAKGKKIFKSSDTVAAYDPVYKGIYLNGDILASPEKFNAYIKKSREAFEYVQKNIDKVPLSKRPMAERYIKAGRELVDDSLEGMILHELGHHAQWNVVSTKLFNELGEDWERIAAKISGYAGLNKSEYIAESFVSWMRGEKLIDSRLQALFDGKLKDVPIGLPPINVRGKKPLFAKPDAQKFHYKEGIAAEMEKLLYLEGSAYWKQLRVIAKRKEFKRLESGIYSALGNTDPDFERLLEASRELVSRGYTSFILPNPNGIPSADLIIVRKGVYKMYDVKTITGEASVMNRLTDSLKQTRRVILNEASTFDSRKMAHTLKSFFIENPDFLEVLIFKGKKEISVSSEWAHTKRFEREFRREHDS